MSDNEQGGSENNENGGGGGNDPWHAGIADESLRGWAENKSFASPEDMARSYWNLEKVVGAEKAGNTVIIPGPNAEQAERDAFFNRLGRPDSKDKYEFEGLPDNADTGFVDWFKDTAHKHGLSSKQASAFVSDYLAFSGGREKEATDKSAADFAAEEQGLKTEWGAAFDQNLLKGRAAAAAFGLDADTISSIEKAAGYAKTMKFFAAIGTKIGELPGLPGGDNKDGGFGTMTPAQAQAKLQELQADKSWLEKYLAGSADHLAQRDRLMRMINGGKA